MSRMTNYSKSHFLEKHRLEARDYGVEWSAELATGVVLSGNPTVTVTDSAGSDVTSEFGVTNLGTSGTQSVWRFGTAGSGQQDGATYTVLIEQGTDNNQTLATVHELYVSELGDTSAP